MARLSWRKQPDERGLASIGQSARGYELRYGGEEIAAVSPVTKGRFTVVGWVYVAVSDEFGIPWKNTYKSEHWPTPEEAKAACDQYVRKHFKRRELP